MRSKKMKRRSGKVTRHVKGTHLQAVYEKVAEACQSCGSKSLAWGIMVGLSSMALSAHNPAHAQDWRGEQPAPDDGNSPRDYSGTRWLNTSGRLLGGDQHPPRHVPGSWLVAQQDAEGGAKQPFDIAAGSLQSALQTFSKQVDLQIFYTSDVVAGLQTQGVKGLYTPQEALDALLAGTGLRYRFSDANTVTLQRAERSETTETKIAQEEVVKPVKVLEIVVKDTKQRTPVVDLPDGYKADVSSEAVLRFPASIQELPQSVSVITKDSMRERRAVTQQEAIEGVAGIGQAPQYGPNADGVNIRGFSFNAFNAGYLRDNGLSVFNNYVADPALYERIEVIKGAASFTSGLVAAGGFVNRLLKAPLNTNFVEAEAGAGSYGHYRTTLDANGVMPNLPVAGRFVFSYNDDPEFFRNTGNRRYSFLPSFRFTTDNDFSVTLTGNIQHLRGKGNVGTPTMTQGLIPGGIEDSFLGNDNRLKIDYHSLHLEADKKFAQGFRLKAKGQYSHDETSYRYSFAYNYGPPTGIGPDGNATIYAYGRDFKRESFAGEVNLTKEFSFFGNPSSVAVGMDYATNRYGIKDAPFINLGTLNIANPQNDFPFPPEVLDPATSVGRDLRFNQTGAFAQGLLRPFSGTTLMAALRGNWITHSDEAPGITGIGNRESLNVTRLTPQVGVSQRVIEGLNIYASYGESIQPNFALTVDRSLLAPQTGQTVEVGGKWESLGGRFRITSAFFRTELDNVATPDPNNPFFSIGGQSQRNQGFEFEARGALLPELQVNLAYTYLDTQITKSTNADAVGARALNTPTHTVSVFGSYDFSNLLTKGLKLGAVVYYRSEVNSFVPRQNETFEGYTRFDLFALYAPLKWLSFQVNINNIADARYIVGPNSYAAFNQFGAPRHVIGMVRMTF